MRISTSQFHQRALNSMLAQQTALSRTQNQVATGKRVESPADDPISAVHILELQRAHAESTQYGRNIDAATARIATEEQALGDAGMLLQRVRELAIQANSSAVDSIGRQAIATELTTRVQELLDLANRRDGNGEYLFSGYATATQPFARGGGNVAYLGDQGSRSLQVGAAQRVTDGHSGYETFQKILQGNGTFVVGVNAANVGSGIIDAGTVVTPAAWVPETYTVSFPTAATFEVRNSASTLIANGAYVAGSAIAFNGVQVIVNGAPAVGDTFSVATSQEESVFTSIDTLISTLTQSGDTPVSRAQFASKMNIALAQLDRGEEHLLNVRAEVGARLSLLSDTQATRADFEVEVQRNISNLQDVDYAEAISRLTRQQMGLQAAQQSYSNIAQLSLFDYL